MDQQIRLIYGHKLPSFPLLHSNSDPTQCYQLRKLKTPYNPMCKQHEPLYYHIYKMIKKQQVSFNIKNIIHFCICWYKVILLVVNKVFNLT